MEKQNDPIVVFKSKKPSRTAYKLREAFKLSQTFDLPYKILYDLFKVSESLDSVICTRKQPEDITLFEIVEDKGYPIPTAKKVEEVVGACLKYPSKNLLFPSYHPTEQEMMILVEWGKEQKITFHYDDNKLTARRE